MPKYQTKRKKNNITSITTWRKLAVHRVIYLGLAGIFGLGMVAYFSTGTPPGGGSGSSTERAASAVVTVNGEQVARSEFDRAWERERSMAGGSEIGTVMMQGQLLKQLIDTALLRSIAKKQGLSVSDEQVDSEIEKMRTSLGTKENPISVDELPERLGVPSMNILRDLIRKEQLPQALAEKIAGQQKVTEDVLRKSYDEVKARHILIATSGGPRPLAGALPDAQARRKAEKILEEVKAGKDFAELANRFTMDPSNKMDAMTGKAVAPKGGDLGWAPYDNYVPEFGSAARALKKGEISGVVKSPFGYHIIKVEDSRSNLPENYAKRKGELLKELRQKRAQKPLQDLVENGRKTAKIVWQAPDLKWKYDYNLIGSGGVMTLGGDTPKNEEKFINDLRKYVKVNPDDSSASLILANELYYKKYLMTMLPPLGKNTTDPTAPNPERDKLRAEVIEAYAHALKRTEDRNAGFTLAELYEQNKQKDKALEQYKSIARVLSWDDSTQNKTDHQRLERAFQKFNAPELAAKERKRIDALTAQELKEKMEKAAEDAKVKAAQKASELKAAQEKAAQAKKPGGPQPSSGTGKTGQ